MIKVSEMKIKGTRNWNTVNWKKIQLRIWRVQRKIYECSRKNDAMIENLRREEPCEGKPSRTVLNHG